MEVLEKTLRIGIDPDVHKSGVAVWDGNDFTHLQTMKFFDLFEYLCFQVNSIDQVVIEAGWLNKKANWHGGNKNTSQRIAGNVGRNHETGRKIVEMCEYLELQYRLVQPRRSKFSRELFERTTGYSIKNQDVIDAAMLVFQS